MSEYDHRQLLLMQQCLSGVDAQRVDTGPLADQLLNLRDVLQCVDRAWDQEFTQTVATLDPASLASPEQRAAMGNNLSLIVADAVSRLRQQVSDSLARYTEFEAA